MKQKYIRLKKYNEIIIFPEIIEHSTFKSLDPVSAGFLHISEDKVVCFGESYSLSLKSDKQDSFYATKQINGWESASKLLTQ